MKNNIRHNVDNLDYQNLVIPKQVLRPVYRILFQHQGVYARFALDVFFHGTGFTKSNLLLDPLSPTD